MIKTASIYLSLDGAVRFCVHAITTMYPTITEGTVYSLKDTDSPEEIGKKALETLHAFPESPIPYPKNKKELKARSIYKHFNVSSQRALSKSGAKRLGLGLLEGDIIKVLPTKNCGQSGDLYIGKERICSIDPKELGQAILAAFEDCE